MTNRRMTLNRLAFSRMTLGKMAFLRMTLKRKVFSIMKLFITSLKQSKSIYYSECRSAECYSTKCRGAFVRLCTCDSKRSSERMSERGGKGKQRTLKERKGLEKKRDKQGFNERVKKKKFWRESL